jgi:hypothetical protein
VSTILSNVLTQQNTSVSDLMGFLSSDDNIADLESSVTNVITQVLATACQANSLSETSNTFNYLSNSTVGGDYLGAVASGDSTNYCTLSNMSKITAYNQVQNNADQSNVSVGLMGVIFGAIILVAGVALIIVIVLVLGIGGIFGLKALGGSKGGSNQNPEQSSFESAVQEEQLALGL